MWQGHLLVTSRQGAEDAGFSVISGCRLGGTTIYGPDPGIVADSITQLSQEIERTSASHLSIARAVLIKLVREVLDVEAIDDRVFSAVLGLTLRLGGVDSILCAAKSDKSYRVFLNERSRGRWHRATLDALDLLREKDGVTVRELESRIFRKREYNTWSSTQHVLQHLSYAGVAHFVGDDACALVRGLT